MSRTAVQALSMARRPNCMSSITPMLRKYAGIRTFATRKQNRLPAAYYRGGTSRAVIFNRKDLPPNIKDWSPIFCGVVGSPDPNGRQLDGLGGGISSLSKVCVVGPSTHTDADVDYTFAAIGVKNLDVDYSSNCGNMTSAIGPYAVDNGLVDINGDEASVRIHNTNTGKLIDSVFPVVEGEAASSGNFAIDGVAGTAAKVRLDFLKPGGSKTGKLFPTGNTIDVLDGVRTTCIDAGNPAVFINACDVDVDGTILPDAMDSNPVLLTKLESIRRKASVAMGISRDEISTPGSIPKIAMVSPSKSHVLLSGATMEGDSVDLIIRALSVGQPHRAVPITVAMACAAAANVEGSVVHANLSAKKVDPEGITLGHSSGKIVVGAIYDVQGDLASVTVFRTARRLMDGFVYWK